MRKFLLWGLAAAFTMLLTLAVFFPASWMGQMLETQTAGRISLGDAQGSVWSGSAFIGAAASSKDPVAALLPGRFSWRLSPMILLGSLDLQLENPEVLAQPITVTGSWSQWQIGPGTLRLPADGLAGLGAPLNTIGFSGQMQLVWSQLLVQMDGKQVAMQGQMQLQMNEMASRLSFIKPLGAYQLQMDWHGQLADVNLKTVKGPLLLSGSGRLDHGRLQFSGKADAEKGQEEKLANLLSLLGQRRNEGGKNIIALEFTQ
ncbi:MAG: type II secretion system protein N [Burkholderiales bacterium]|nr:type II secretion system protein N [Burkholderiales bacterium]